MYNNYDYPAGADGPNAPWNQTEPNEEEFDVCISQTLSKSSKVHTNDYIPMIDESEDGRFPYADTSETNWKEAYENEHMTPLEIIEECKKLAEDAILNYAPNSGTHRFYSRLIKECEGWVEDETEVIEE